MSRPFDKYEKSPNSAARSAGVAERKSWKARIVSMSKSSFTSGKSGDQDIITRIVFLRKNKPGWIFSLHLGPKKQAFCLFTLATPDLVEAQSSHELQCQEVRESSRRQLVYQIRGDLREKLRQLRSSFAQNLRYDKVYFVLITKPWMTLLPQCPQTYKNYKRASEWDQSDASNMGRQSFKPLSCTNMRVRKNKLLILMMMMLLLGLSFPLKKL